MKLSNAFKNTKLALSSINFQSCILKGGHYLTPCELNNFKSSETIYVWKMFTLEIRASFNIFLPFSHTDLFPRFVEVTLIDRSQHLLCFAMQKFFSFPNTRTIFH